MNTNNQNDSPVRRHRHGYVKRLWRQRLLAENPRCSICGKRLQSVDHTRDNYAHVVDVVLCCRGCVKILAGLVLAELLY